MTPGSRSRRIATQSASGTVASLILVAMGGCNGIPFARVAPAPNRPQSTATLGSVGRAALLPATVALDTPSEMASIDPSNSTSGTLTPASAIGSAPKADLISTETPISPSKAGAEPLAPTPLLDEALQRARSRGEVVDPASEPAPAVNLAGPPPVAAPTEMAPTIAAVEPPSLIVAPPVLIPAPEPKPIEVVAAQTPASPEELWREGVRKLVGLARSKQEQGSGTGGEPWGLRARVLAWLAEPDIDPDLGQHDADTVRSVLRALQASAAGDPRADAPNRGDDVRLAVQTLEAKAPLELVDLRLCSKVKRFGDFTPFDPPMQRAGESVVIYCEVDGVHHEPTSEGFKTKLAGRLELIPEAGGPAVVAALGTAEETLPRRRRDYCISYLKSLPHDLPPGQYTVRITLKDVYADRSASRGTSLTVLKSRETDAVVSSPHESLTAP